MPKSISLPQQEMDWAAFQSKMDTPQMLEFFRGIDVDPSEAKVAACVSARPNAPANVRAS